MTLSIPNASIRRLFDAQPNRSDAAPSIVIQPSVMYVSNSANRKSSERCPTGEITPAKRCSSIFADMIGRVRAFKVHRQMCNYAGDPPKHLPDALPPVRAESTAAQRKLMPVRSRRRPDDQARE